MDRLKACPFCGDYYGETDESLTSGKWAVSCRFCHGGFDYIFDSEEEAIARWNEREYKEGDEEK